MTPPTRVWQIRAGNDGRDYADVFLRFGVAAVGPGDPGPFRDRYCDPTDDSYRRWLAQRPRQLRLHALALEVEQHETRLPGRERRPVERDARPLAREVCTRR
jgi:hypothetical protein